MRTELWGEFAGQVSASPRLLATVTAHNGDGTSSVATYDGSQMSAIGTVGGSIPYNVWIRAGRVVEAAPNLPLVEVSI
jgi:hypothetical protein